MWVMAGSTPAAALDVGRIKASSLPFHRHSRRTPSPLALLAKTGFSLLLQSWMTVIGSFGMGAAYLQSPKPEYLFAPAGIALLFFAQSLVRSSPSDRVVLTLLGIKLFIAYAFFVIGLVVAGAGIVRW